MNTTMHSATGTDIIFAIRKNDQVLGTRYPGYEDGRRKQEVMFKE